MSATTARPFLSMDDAAEHVGVSPRTIRRRIEDGTLPAYRVGRQIRVKVEDLAQLLMPVPTRADHDAELAALVPVGRERVG